MERIIAAILGGKCNTPSKILILASGRGTDFQAIADHQSLGIFNDVSIAGLISNHENAEVLKRAEKSGVRSFVIDGITGKKYASSDEREEARRVFDLKCIETADIVHADLIVLAGFDQIVSKDLVESFPFKIMNIHPAYDLRRFGGRNMVGMKVHEEVLRSGVGYSGCTIHYVTNDIDGGPVILKKRADIDRNEDAASLEKKILELEHIAYPEAIQMVSDGRVIVDETGSHCYVDRYSGGWDIDWVSRQRKYLSLRSE